MSYDIRRRGLNMKFKIVEERELLNAMPVSEIVKFIEQNCQPVLREIAATKGAYGAKLGEITLLYRGIKTAESMFIGTVRKNRKPKDTSDDFHQLFDDSFSTIFGWKPRSAGLFATGRYLDAKMYGITFVVFPIGDFNFIYSEEISDLFVALENMAINNNFIEELDIKNKKELSGKWKRSSGPHQNSSRYGMLKKYPEILDAFIKQNYTDENFQGGIMSRHEIMIKCDKYVAIEKEFYDDQKFSDFLFTGIK